MHSVNAFPPEILDHIIRNVEQLVPPKAYFPQFPLSPLIRVCKLWQPIAERRLYRSVSIGSDLYSFTNFYHSDIDALEKARRPLAYLAMYNDPRCKSRGGDEFVRQFRDAIRDSPRLGKLVNTLRLKGRIAKLDQPRMENFIEILRLCPNVTHLELQDCHYPVLLREPLMAVLQDHSDLVSLIVKNVDHKDSEHVFGTADFICAMRHWPNVRHIEVNIPRRPPSLSGIDETISDIDIKLNDISRNCCPQLHGAVFPQARLRADHLRTLRRICCSGIEKFEATVSSDDETLLALRECLTAWAPSLRTLYLHFAVRPDPDVVLDIIPSLDHVEDLEVSSPRDAECLPPIEKDLYRKSWMRIIKGFWSASEDPTKLPRIRRLSILFKGLHDPELIDSEKHLDELCVPRDIKVLW